MWKPPPRDAKFPHGDVSDEWRAGSVELKSTHVRIQRAHGSGEATRTDCRSLFEGEVHAVCAKGACSGMFSG